MELVSIEICNTLHQLHYFCDLRTISIEGEVLTATDGGREENAVIPKIKPPRLHEVSHWLRKKKKIDINIECRPRLNMYQEAQESSIWTYRIFRLISNKDKHVVASCKRQYSQYGDALEGAIEHVLRLIENKDI